jgi:hypothetical protein
MVRLREFSQNSRNHTDFNANIPVCKPSGD